MSEVTSNRILELSFQHVSKKRQNDSHNSDIWELRYRWHQYRDEIRTTLLNGTYQLSPIQVCGNKKGHRLTRWTAKDVVVLKAISMVISGSVQQQVDHRCYHIKGNGGLKGAVNQIHDHLGQYSFCVKSDIADFYASMDHQVVMQECKKIIKDKRILKIINQYLNRVEINHGSYDLITRGLAKGCSLSPIIGAIMLKSLDTIIPKGSAYARYMDDWLILTKTRGQLRRLIKKMHDTVRCLKLKLAIDKTYIGRIKNGFDFLGYRFNHRGLIGFAKKTIDNYNNHITELYEHHTVDNGLASYIKHWRSWALGGLRPQIVYRLRESLATV